MTTPTADLDEANDRFLTALTRWAHAAGRLNIVGDDRHIVIRGSESTLVAIGSTAAEAWKRVLEFDLEKVS